MQRYYQPNAIAIDVDAINTNIGKSGIRRLCTYNSCYSLQEARDVINSWINEHNYVLVSSYIEHSWDKKRVDCKFYEENIKVLEYGDFHRFSVSKAPRF